jgi:diphthine-ammonia ligase
VKVFSSWSGGKECALATYEAISQGHEVLCLLNFISEDGERTRSHGTKASVLALQAEAIGIPLMQVKTSWEGYEQNFKKAVRELKDKGIEGGVFGDIDLDQHREWVERVCGEVGIKAFLPLWGVKPEKLIDEFLTLRFKAVIVATKLDENFLGKVLNKALVRQISKLGSHPCGENGEYHTFVTEGPMFTKALRVTGGQSRRIDGMWFQDISAEVIASPDSSGRSNLSRLTRRVYPEQRQDSSPRQVGTQNNRSEGPE